MVVHMLAMRVCVRVYFDVHVLRCDFMSIVDRGLDRVWLSSVCLLDCVYGWLLGSAVA